jgi:gluconolactonase
VFADLSAGVGEGVPDGMKVDREGRVYCTGPSGCWVWDADGRHLGTIELPETPANMAWGGPDYRTMLFTTRASVYRMRMKVEGARPPAVG